MIMMKEGTHYVLKRSDVYGALSAKQFEELSALIKVVEQYRQANGKPLNKYYICNKDEPYAEEVLSVILKGEVRKELEIFGYSV